MGYRDVPSDDGMARFTAMVAELQRKVQMLLERDATGAAGPPGPTGPTGPTGPGLVYQNGVLLPSPKIASGSAGITATGAYGIYALNFAPVTFAAAPIVVAWCSLTSGGLLSELSLSSVNTTSFSFYIQAFTPGQSAVPVGTTFTVEWIAVGA